MGTTINRVLCVVAHPDDETLMCGGTIAKHINNGDSVTVLAMADGVTSRSGSHQLDASERGQMFVDACLVLGVKERFQYGFCDNRMDNFPLLDTVIAIERKIIEIEPSVVYTHWHGDMNIDHRVVSDAAKIACRPQPGCSVKQLLMGEVPCSTGWAGGFNPDYFVEITDTLDKKIRAAECYKTEMRDYPHPRSLQGIKALAQYQGSRCGLRAAEAFITVRSVA